jgi:hypothetical protein
VNGSFSALPGLTAPRAGVGIVNDKRLQVAIDGPGKLGHRVVLNEWATGVVAEGGQQRRS